MAHDVTGTGAAQAKKIERFFYSAFQIAEANRSDNVIDYMVKMTRSWNVDDVNWEKYENLLITALRMNVGIVNTVSEIFVKEELAGRNINKKLVRKFVIDSIKKNAQLGNHFEVSWALFLSDVLSIPIDRDISSLVTEMDSGVCALMLLHLRSKGLLDGQVDDRNWKRFMNEDGLYSEMWLLAYEADLKGWLDGSSANYPINDTYFGALRRKRVSFFDGSRKVRIRHPRRVLNRNTLVPQEASSMAPESSDSESDITSTTLGVLAMLEASIYPDPEDFTSDEEE